MQQSFAFSHQVQSIDRATSCNVPEIDVHYIQAVLARKFPGISYLEDIVQDAVVKILSKKDLFDPTKSAFNTWCVKVGYNACIDNIRRRQVNNRGIEYLKTLSSGYSVEITPDTIGLTHLVNQLEEPEKAVIKLAYYKGYTHQEISEHMQIPLGTVKTRMTRAISKLRKYFEIQ